MASSARPSLVAPIITLVIALVAMATAVTVSLTAGKQAGAAVAQFDLRDIFLLDDMPTAPIEQWSTPLGNDGLRVYTSNSTEVDGDPLLYLTYPTSSQGPGEIVRFDADTGERKWTAEVDYPASCYPPGEGRYLPCHDHRGDGRTLRYIDLDTGTLTDKVFAPKKVLSVREVDAQGTEFLVAYPGPETGQVTVSRGSPAEIDAAWTNTFEVADDSPQFVIRTNGLATIGYGSEPGDSATFDLATGEPADTPESSYDPNLWTWSERTEIRVDPADDTFEILNADGRVVGRGDDARNHTTVPRLLGTDYESVVLVGDSAYDADTGERLWSDDRLVKSDSETSVFDSNVAAIVDNTVVLEIRGQYPAGSLVGLDLDTGRELWRQDYRTHEIQRHLDSSRWIAIIDDQLVAFDVRTGEESWSVTYPGAGPTATPYDSSRLLKLDKRRLAVITSGAITVYEQA